MSEVVNIPQLRFPEFNGGWKESRIGKIYKDLRTGSTPSRAVKSYFKGDNPWITSGELKYNRISTTFEQISDEAIKDTNLVLYQPGTLFIAITGLEAPGTRGKCAINAVPSTTNQSCLAFRKVDSVDTIYMFYWYLKYGKPLYFKYAQGTKQQSFNNKIVEKFQIFLPNKPEQQKIAAFLSAVDNKIEQLSKKQELLGEYKKGSMQQIFSQAIRFKADDGSEFPEWKERRLGDVCSKAKSGGTPRSTTKEYYDGDIPFLAISDITRQGKYLTSASKKISQLGIDNSASWIVPIDTIIYSMYASVGFVSINKIPLATSQAVINLIVKDGYSIEFIYYHLIEVKKTIHKFIETGTQGNLNAQTVKSLILNIPSLPEQAKIANFLSSIDNKIEQVGKQLDESKQFKKALLQQMFV